MKVVCNSIILLFILLVTSYSQDRILNHSIVLNVQGKLLPWTSYDNIINWSIGFIKNCPTKMTKFGDDPLYIITAKLEPDGSYIRKQNNQGSNVYWAVETHRKYFAYSGDYQSLDPVRKLINRVIYYHTPSDWAWPNVPRTQDDTSDGEYTDEWAGVDKICMAAIGYIKFYKLTSENIYLDKALDIAKTVLQYIKKGDNTHSPLPFRVNLKTGEVLDPYSSDMIFAAQFIDELITINDTTFNMVYLETKRRNILNWIFNYPLKSNMWAGYFEDMNPDIKNYNQVNPMETARYILSNHEVDPNYKSSIRKLLNWVKIRYKKAEYYGSTSIAEQDSFYLQMGSHTARYGSVLAMWSGVSLDQNDREEANATLALATYSAYNEFSTENFSINTTGIEYPGIWFSDSYWDYLSHFFDAMQELPEMLPENENHLFYSSSIVTDINYSDEIIEYKTFDKVGEERIKLKFEPIVYANDKVLEKEKWVYGAYNGVPNILTIMRNNMKHIIIKKK